MVLAADCDGDFEICTWGLQDSVCKTYTNYDFEIFGYFILLLVEAFIVMHVYYKEKYNYKIITISQLYTFGKEILLF